MKEVFEAVLAKLKEQANHHRNEAGRIGKTAISNNEFLRVDYHRQRADEIDEIVDCLDAALKGK